MLRTIKELEDKNNVSRHFDIKIDPNAVLDDNRDLLKVIDQFEEIEHLLVVVPNEWADHTHIEID